MSSTKTIQLDDTAVYDLGGGKVYTLKELRQHAMDSDIVVRPTIAKNIKK